MRLAKGVYLVGGGDFAFNLSGRLDCHIYLIDGGSELALIDAGLGLAGSIDLVVENIREDGLDPARIGKLILTHAHADHAGGAREIRDRFYCEVLVPHDIAYALQQADEEAISLQYAKDAGFYPPEYHFPACPVDQEVREDDVIQVGSLSLTAYETPGHSAGHISYLMRGADRTFLFGGDLVFWGGKVLLQNIPDCSIQAYADSVMKIEKLDFDALLPGHLSVSLRDGKRHIDSAAASFRKLGIPPNIL
ncbi:MAG: MBL fold metallo-hydrolase [Chloroflexota bacterium]|nr:MBL fold metallo-hydrolase [Chloroflexota bacterium]